MSKVDKIYRISGIFDIAVSDNKNLLHIYGYNSENDLGIWHKTFGQKVDTPCRLGSLHFQENGQIKFAKTHPSLPLFLTVSESHGHNVILISYECDKNYTHAGHFIPINEHVADIFWLNNMPIFIILTTEGTLRFIGPNIEPVLEDINSFTSMLKYSMNTHTPYSWKIYYTKDAKEFPNKIDSILHINTIHKMQEDKFTEIMLLFSKNTVFLATCSLSNVLNQDDIDIQVKIKGKTELTPGAILQKYVLKSPINTDREEYIIGLRRENNINIYVSKSRNKKEEWNFIKSGDIPLPLDTEIIRINSYQIPLVAVMDSSKLVKIYNSDAKYMGFINFPEIHSALQVQYGLDVKLKKVDFIFYHNTNIQALVVLFNKKMVLLCNNFQYEVAFDFIPVEVFSKPVPYEIDLPIIELEQTSQDAIILSTTNKSFLIRKEAVKRVIKDRKNEYLTIKSLLHSAHEMYAIYHPALLREYLTFGDMKKLCTILRLLYGELKKRKELDQNDKISQFLNIPVSEIINSKNIVSQHEETKSSKIEPELENTEESGSSIFDDIMFESKKPLPKIKQVSATTHTEDIEDLVKIKDEFIELIQESSGIYLEECDKQELISLITNLRELVSFQKAEDEIAQEFLLHMNVSNVRWNLGQKVPITTMDIALAYHCQNQDMLLKLILNNVGAYSWDTMKRYGIPLWLKDIKKLKDLIEQVAKTEFQKSKEQDANKVGEVAIWYIMLKKRNVLSNLYQKTNKGQKVYEFLSHDFAEDRWKKAAVRNAYQLFSQKKYPTAAAFYLLGGQINEATQVAITHLKDLYLAITMCRLYEAEGQDELNRLYREYYIEKGKLYGDPWIVSLGHWLSGDCIDSLNCISDTLLQAEPKLKDEMDPHLNMFYKEDSVRKRKLTEEWAFDSPMLSTFNASMIVLCRKLEKHYLVTSALKHEEQNAPHKSVEDSIFGAFMSEPEEKKEEKKIEESIKKELELKIENLVLKGAQMYSKLKLPHLSLYMIYGESQLIKESIFLF